MGCCYIELQDFLSALRVLKKIEKDCPNWERPVFNIGRLYLKLGKLEKALKYFQKAVYINPNEEDTYYYLGLYYYEIKEYENAIYYYQKSLEINERQSETHLNLGRCYARTNMNQNALEEFDLAYKYDNDCGDAIRNKGIVYIYMKNYTKALEFLFDFYKLHPNDTENMLDIAHCYYKINSLSNSKIWINKVLILDPNYEMAKKLLNNVNYLSFLQTK